MDKIAIFGCSGFALEVADICYDLGYKTIILLSNETDTGKVNGLDIHSEMEVRNLHKLGYSFAIGIGDGLLRKKISEKYSDLKFPNLIHTSAIFGRGQKDAFNLKCGNIITAGVIFTNNIQVGNHGVFNLSATIGHDCIIEDYVSIMPSVNVSGNVHLKNGCMIGVGAVILQGKMSEKLVVAEGAIVGAQSLVIKGVSPNTTVFGVPARVIK